MKITVLLLILLATFSLSAEYLVLVPVQTPGPGVFYGYFGGGELRATTSPANAVCALPDNRDNLYIVFLENGAPGLPPEIEQLGLLTHGAVICDLKTGDVRLLVSLNYDLLHLEPTIRSAQRDAPAEILAADAQEIVERVDLDHIDAYIYDLTQFRTRYAYTQGNNQAGDYIAAELLKNGFSVIEEGWLGAQPQSLDAEDNLVAFSLASSHLFYSTDGGTTFIEYFPTGEIDAWENGACVVFPPGTIHFAGGNTYHRTGNGGASWMSIQFDLGSKTNYFSAMAFADGENGYLFGASGDVWRTVDGGDTWEEAGNTGLEVFEAVSFPEHPEVVIGVSRIETVLRSTDGGETWEKVNETSGGSTLYDLAFGDADRGMAVGTTNRVLTTDDGGETWNSSQIPGVDATQQLYSVTSLGPLEYIVGSLYGELYHTEDGGESWEAKTTGRASAVKAGAWDLTNGRVWIATTDGPAFGEGDVDELTWRIGGINPQTIILWENIIGEKTGSDYPQNFVYGTAHFDSISGRGGEDEDPYVLAPGANDNGSGTTALLEISRVLADFTPKRSLRLAFFNAEELGLRGSFHYTRQLALEGIAVDGALNLDMVVWSDPADVQEDLDVITDYRSEWLADVLMEACARYGDGMPGLKILAPDFYRSDHAAFWFVGYPALLGIEDIDVPYPYYHKDEDDYPMIQDNLPLTRQVTRAALGALAGLCGIHDDYLFDLTNVYAYPNPYRGDLHDGVTFNGLIPGAELRVYDLNGNLVYETTSNAYELDWDVRNSAGAVLASGVYLYHVSAPRGDAVTAKLAVIR
ncbi:M28 family peptidase [bacterium]|nr:M28 family peptidase [bacterium]